MYRIEQLKLSHTEAIDKIPQAILKKINKRELAITDYEVVRESIDARNKEDIKIVYTVDFNVVYKNNLSKKAELKENPKLNLSVAKKVKYSLPERGSEQLQSRPVIVGFGPCGMFAGLIFAQAGYRPLIVERGSTVEERSKKVDEFWKNKKLDTECNVQFGEGGAGTFSDGKLTTGIKDPRIRKVLEELVLAGANKEILYKQKPHIGTDVLRHVVRNIRKKIISLGGEILFDTKLVGINLVGNKVVSVDVVGKDQSSRKNIESSNIIMAMGHSARDTFELLHSLNMKMEQKPFSMGVRVEHDQKIIDAAQYGNAKGLPPAEYKVACHLDSGRSVYSFCMCPGGEVIMASSEENGIVVNGMSNNKRNSGTANSAILCDVKTSDFESDHPLGGVHFQRKYERMAFSNAGGYNVLTTTWKEFRDENIEENIVGKSLPDFVSISIKEAMPIFANKIKNFDKECVIIKGIETRSSSPVRMIRNEDYESNLAGIYPAGEGAGYAGGITSAACDGIKVAEKIISKYKI